eukprot:3938350-Rhodomonas_salina.1
MRACAVWKPDGAVSMRGKRAVSMRGKRAVSMSGKRAVRLRGHRSRKLIAVRHANIARADAPKLKRQTNQS